MDKTTKFDEDKEKMREALRKRAYGYEVEEKEVVADRTGRPEKVVIRRRHIPPDLTALRQIEYLQNIGKW